MYTSNIFRVPLFSSINIRTIVRVVLLREKSCVVPFHMEIQAVLSNKNTDYIT